MVVICYDSDTIEYERRIPEPSNAAIHITQDANSIEKFGVNLPAAPASAALRD